MEKLGQVCSKRHVPPELCTEILCRLPVKSLLICRCVSKSWLSLIGSRDFARVHLNKFKNNREETHLLVVHTAEQNIFVRRSDTFKADSKRLVTLGYTDREGSWDFLSSIDGLLLLKRVSGYPYVVNDLKVWNPSIRKFHEFPSLPGIETPPPDGYLYEVDIGLGYDQLAKIYKHVKLIITGDISSRDILKSVAIYALGTGSWKIIQFQGKSYSWHWDLHGAVLRRWEQMFIGLKKQVCFQGSLYFLARVVNQQSECWDLISCDLSRETFSSIRLLPDIIGPQELVLIDGRCSLAVFSSPDSSRWRRGTEYSMWVLESSEDGSESMCWTKRYSFHPKPKLDLIYIKKDGDILTRSSHFERVIYETGKKVVRWDRVASYNAETDEYKTLREKMGSYSVKLVSAYTESLILLN